MAERKSILIVDDDLATLQLLRYMLEFCGYEVTVCGSSREALQMFSASRFDALLTDYNMSGPSGLELAISFRARFPGTLVVGMSGFEMAEAFAAVGADHFLRKPVLAQQIERIFCAGRS